MSVSAQELVTARTTIYLSVFKWETRKGWDLLLSAFFAEFGEDDDVSLPPSTWPMIVLSWPMIVLSGRDPCRGSHHTSAAHRWSGFQLRCHSLLQLG